MSAHLCQSTHPPHQLVRCTNSFADEVWFATVFCPASFFLCKVNKKINSSSYKHWHQRLAHTGLNNVSYTRHIVNGLNIEANTKSPLNSIVCDACELGTPLERKQRCIRNKVTDALARIHVDTFQILPEGFNSHKYGMILTDEATSEP